MNNTVKSSSIKTVNPFNNEVVKEFEVMTSAQVNAIIDKADEAFKSWKNTSFASRAAIIHKVSQIMRERKVELGKLATLEMGKLLSESIYEVELSANILIIMLTKQLNFWQTNRWMSNTVMLS